MPSKKKTSISKHTPNNSWFKNAVKSMGLASTDLIKDMAPSLYETGASLYNVSKEARAAMKSSSNKTLTNQISNFMETNPYTKMARNTIKNALDDLKTGNLYNKERADKQMEADFGLDVLDDLDSMLDGLDDVDFGDFSDDSVDVTVNNNVVPSESPKIAMAVADSINEGSKITAQATLTAAKAQTDTMIAVTSNAVANLSSVGNAMLKKLDSIDSNLGSIVSYMNENMTKFIEASSKYYETMLSHNGVKGESETSYSVEGDKLTPFGDNGGIDFKNLGKFISANAKKALGDSTVGSLGSLLLLAPSAVENGLLPAILKGGISSIIPSIVKSSIGELEKTFSAFGQTMMAKAADLSYSANPIMSMIGKIFGQKEDRKRTLNLTKFEKGAIPFDGMTKHSIVEIIPHELRKIQEILSGKEADVYDWETGKYTSASKVRQHNRELIRQEGEYAMQGSEFGRQMSNRKYLLQEKDQEKFENLLSDFYDKLTNFEGFFDPTKRESFVQLFPEMGLQYGDDMKNYFMKAVQAMSTPALMSINPARNKGIRQRRQMMQSMEENPYEYQLFATEMDSKNSAAYTHIKEPSTNTGSKKNTKFEGLRSIYDLLVRGINVRLLGKGPFEGTPTSESESTKPAGGIKRTLTRAKNRAKEKFTRKKKDKSSSDSDDDGPYLQKPLSEYSDEEIDEHFRRQDEFEASLEPTDEGNGIAARIRRGLKGPAQNIAGASSVLQKMMRNFAFGSGADAMNVLAEALMNKLEKIGDTINDNIITPLKNAFVGERDEQGFSRGGIFSNVLNSSKDFMNSVWSRFNGKGYTKSNGEKVAADPDNSVMGSLRKGLNTVKDETLNYLFGKKDEKTGKREKKGFLSEAKERLSTGLNNWADLIFGKKTDENGEEVKRDVFADIKKNAPQAVAGGMVGAAVGTVSGMGGFGLLGSMFLPGGPIGGAIVGTAASFLGKSKRFQDFLFGEKDDKGERTGGLISKNVQDFFKKNKTSIIGGAAVGTIKSIITGGGGLLTGLIGGPLAGAIMGSAFGLLKNSNVVKEFLYGKGDPDSPDYKKGLINTIKDKFKTADGKNKLGMIGAGAGIGAMSAAVFGNMGMVGAMLCPGGPIGGAIMGAASGIAMSSDKFRNLIFGEIDKDTGKRHGGLVQKFQDYVSKELFTPAKLFMKGVALDAKDFLKDKVLEPMLSAMDPIVAEFKFIGGQIKDKVTEIATRVTDSIKEVVVKPLGAALNKYLVDPLKKVGSTVFNAIFGVVKAIVGAPFKAIGAFGEALVGRQTGRAVDDERKSLKDRYHEQGLLKGLGSYIVDSVKLELSPSRRQAAAEKRLPYLQGRDEEIAKRRDNRYIEKKTDFANLERENIKSFNERFKSRAKGYDVYSEAGYNNLSSRDKKKVDKEMARRKKEGAKIDSENARRILKGLRPIPNPYADGKDIFFDKKKGEAVAKLVGQANEKRKKRGQATIPDPFNNKPAEKPESTEEETKISENGTSTQTSEQNQTAESKTTSENPTIKSQTTTESAKTEEKNGNDQTSETKEETKIATPKENAPAPQSSSYSTSSSDSSVSGSRKNESAEERKRRNWLKDIRDEVHGQLNGVGSNINKIKRMLGKALGVKDVDKDDGGNNKEYKSFADRFFDFMARPLHNTIKLVTAPIRFVQDTIANIKEKVSGFVNGIKELPGKIFNGALGVIKGIGSAVGGMVNAALGAVGNVASSLIKGVGVAGKILVEGATGLISGAANVIGTTITSIADVGSAVVGGVAKIAEAIPGLIGATAEALGAIARTGLSLVGAAFETGAKAIISAGKVLKSAVFGIAGTLWKGVKGILGGALNLGGRAVGWAAGKLGIKRKPKEVYVGEIKRITEPVTVKNDEKSPLHIVVDNFNDNVKVKLHQESIDSIRGYDEDGDLTDAIKDFFGLGGSSSDENGAEARQSLISSLLNGVSSAASGIGSIFGKRKKPDDVPPPDEGKGRRVHSYWGRGPESKSDESGDKKPENTQMKMPVPSMFGGLSMMALLTKLAGGAKGGRDANPDEASEDAEDAAVLKAKVAENTKKDAKYMQAQKEAEKEKAEQKAMQKRQTDALENIKIQQKEHNSAWDFIFSKKGLITAGIIALSPFLLKLAKKIINFKLSDFISNLVSGIGDTIKQIIGNINFGFQNTDTGKEAEEQADEYSEFITGKDENGESKGPIERVTDFVTPDGEHDATSDSRLKLITKPVERGIHGLKTIGSRFFKFKDTLKNGGSKIEAIKNASGKVTFGDRYEAGVRMTEGAVDGAKNIGGKIKNTIASGISKINEKGGSFMGKIADKITGGKYGAELAESSALQHAAATFGDEAAETAVKNGGTVGSALKSIASEAASKMSETKIGKLGSAAKGAASGVADTVSKAFTGLGDFLAKKFPKASQKITEIISKLSSKLIGDESFLGKIAAKLSAKVGGKTGIAAATLGASEVVFAVIGAVDGATSASNMFVCKKEDVDWLMIAISTAFKTFLTTTLGTIIDVVDSIAWATLGISVVRSVAQAVYGAVMSATGNSDKVDALNNSQQELQNDYLKYVDEKKDAAYQEYLKGLDDPSTALDEDTWWEQMGKDSTDIDSFADYNDEQNKTMFHKATDAIKSAAGGVKNAVGKAGAAIKSGASTVINGVKGAASTAWSAISDTAGKAWNKTKEVAGAVGGKVKEVASAAWDKVTDVTGAAWNKITDVKDAIGDKVTEITDAVAPVVKEVTRTFKNAGKKIAGMIGDKVNEVLDPIKQKFGEFKDAVGEKVGDMVTGIKDMAGAAKDKIVEFGTKFAESFGAVKDAIGEKITAFGEKAGEVFNSAKEKVGEAIEPVKELAGAAVDKVKEGIGWVGDKFKEKADEIADIGTQIWTKLGDVWGDVKEKVGELADNVKKNFEKGLSNLNSTFGSLFGFADKDGNPVSFTDGIKTVGQNIKNSVTSTIKSGLASAANLWIKFSNWANDENKSYITGDDINFGNGKGRGISRRGRRLVNGYRALGRGRGSDAEVFSQTDPKWNADDPSMRDNGCGPTVAAMIANRYGTGRYGTGANPSEANDMSYRFGMRDTDGGTNPAFFSEYGASHGINMQEGPVNSSMMQGSLSAGRPMALMGQGGAFGSGMHYLMADGIKGTSVNLVDPIGGVRKTSSLTGLVQNTSSAIYSGRGRFFRFGKGTNNKKKTIISGKAIQQEGEIIDSPPDLKNGRGRIGRWGRGDETKNGMVYYNQADDRWSGHTTGGSSTLGHSGCVISSLAMCVSQIAGKAITPPDIVEKHSYTLSGGGMIWGNMTKVAGKFGGEMTALSSKDAIITALKAGKPVLIYGEKTRCPVCDYSDSGSRSGPHCVVIACISSDGKSIKVNDPGKRERCDKTLSVDTIRNFDQAYAASKGGKGVSGGAVDFSSGDTTSSTSTSTSDSGNTSSGGTFFDKLSSGITEIGSRLWEGAITGNYNTDFSTFFSGDSSSSSSSSGSSGSLPSGDNLIGDYVKQFESGDAGPEMISSGSGDAGGVSFGTYQFPSYNKTPSGGLLQKFWDTYYKSEYPNVTPGNNSEFKTAWKQAVAKDKSTFHKREWMISKDGDYKTALDLLKKQFNYNPDKDSRAAQEAIWSTALQAPAIVPGIYKLAFGSKDVTSMDDAEWVKKFYKAKRDNVPNNFRSSSAAVQRSVYNRYINEEPIVAKLAGQKPMTYEGSGAGRGRWGRGRNDASASVVRGRSTTHGDASTRSLEHAYRKSVFGRGSDDAFNSYYTQQTIIQLLKQVVSNTASTVDAVNGIDIPETSNIIYQGGNSTATNVSVQKPTKSSGSSMTSQKVSRNERIARSIARGTT